MWRAIRIGFLLFVLLVVAQGAWIARARTTDWKESLRVVIYPIRMFVLYFAPTENRRLAHSVGLQQGLLGVVNAFATIEMEGQNNVVITHELLHIFGATDKYDFATYRPRFPDGYAEPHASPLHPQTKAEIMAGRIPLSAMQTEMPRDLDQAVIGAQTAKEISWLR